VVRCRKCIDLVKRRSINERINEATERLADEKQQIPEDGSRYLSAYRDHGSIIYTDHMDHIFMYDIRIIKVRMKQHEMANAVRRGLRQKQK